MIRINAPKEYEAGNSHYSCLPLNLGIKKPDGFEWLSLKNPQQVKKVSDALDLILNKQKNGTGVDQFFEQLPLRRSLSAIVEDSARIVTISRTEKGQDLAETDVLAITLNETVIHGPLHKLAATLLHELAHTSGAQDYDQPTSGQPIPAAERVLKASKLLSDQFDEKCIIARPGANPVGAGRSFDAAARPTIGPGSRGWPSAQPLGRPR